MKVEMGKKYKTRSGVSVRILAVDLANALYTVAGFIEGEGVYMYTSEGGVNEECGNNHKDLVEVSEWDDFKIDDKVMVRNHLGNWERRYFAGVEEGKPTTFAGVSTLWTNVMNPVEWDECRKPTEKELE